MAAALRRAGMQHGNGGSQPRPMGFGGPAKIYKFRPRPGPPLPLYDLPPPIKYRNAVRAISMVPKPAPMFIPAPRFGAWIGPGLAALALYDFVSPFFSKPPQPAQVIPQPGWNCYHYSPPHGIVEQACGYNLGWASQALLGSTNCASWHYYAQTMFKASNGNLIMAGPLRGGVYGCQRINTAHVWHYPYSSTPGRWNPTIKPYTPGRTYPFHAPVFDPAPYMDPLVNPAPSVSPQPEPGVLPRTPQQPRPAPGRIAPQRHPRYVPGRGPKFNPIHDPYSPPLPAPFKPPKYTPPYVTPSDDYHVGPGTGPSPAPLPGRHIQGPDKEPTKKRKLGKGGLAGDIYGHATELGDLFDNLANSMPASYRAAYYKQSGLHNKGLYLVRNWRNIDPGAAMGNIVEDHFKDKLIGMLQGKGGNYWPGMRGPNLTRIGGGLGRF